MQNSQQTSLDLNGPILSFTSQPQATSILSSGTYSGTISSLIATTYNNYPVRGYLYYPTSSNVGTSVDVVVLYHGTITDQGVSPADAASTFINIALNRVNIKDKLIFSVAYPQDAIPLWEANPSLPSQQFPGLNYPTLYLGDNIVYAEAALLWVKNSLNSYLSSNGISKTINRVFTFGHSQGAYLAHRLNTMHAVDGVISNAPGPIDLLDRCSGAQNTSNFTCNKIRVGFGTTTANPSAYNTRSLKSYLSGTLSPTLFTQALDDDSYQVNLMQNTVQVGLSTCTNCSTSTFNYYATGGHDAFVTNTDLQRDIRNFIGSSATGIATFVGVATATFVTVGVITNPATNTGYVTYRWNEVGVGALTDGTYVTGSATTSLTLRNLVSPTDNRRQFFLSADYVPSAYGLPGVAVTVGSARSTGNAIVEPVISGITTLTVYPNLEIIAQPSDSAVPVNSTATFNIVSTLTDSTFPDDLTYQWFYNGNAITDGTVTVGYLQSTTTTTQINYQTVVSDITRTDPVFETVCQDVFENQTRTIEKSNTATFTSPGSVTLPPTSYNVKVRVAGGAGGRGGFDYFSGSTNQAVGGNGTGGRFGEFSYVPGGRTLSFMIGKRGNDGENFTQNKGGGRGGDGLNRGGDGGNAGSVGSSGAGGGGGGSTGVYDSNFGDFTIVASGGGGGGGGSRNIPGAPANPGAGGFEPDGRNRSEGRPGEPAGGGDGGGGGGGGAGTNNSPNSQTGAVRPIQLGGRSGRDDNLGNRQALGGGNGADNNQGGQSFGGFNRNAASFGFNGSQNDGDGYAQVSYNWTETVTERVFVRRDCQQVRVGERTVVIGQTTSTVAVPTTVTSTANTPINVTFSGSRTPTLSVTASQVVGVATVFCRVSSPTATNSPIRSNLVEYKATPTANNFLINLEQISETNVAALTTVNLINGAYTINKPIPSANINQIILYAPDRDINVEMDLFGGRGTDFGSYVGGEGGFSRIRFTMTRNTEYVIAGLTDAINTPFLYRKGQLIACVGSGGNAGGSGRGGFGGGVGVAGQAGSGRGAGNGGSVFAAGSLPPNGIFGSLSSVVAISPDINAVTPSGGRTLPCTKGVYWRDQGYSACQDIGTSQFRLTDGTLVTNTGSITRGYKAGYDIIQTAGAKIGNGGIGGNGATGGQGGNEGGGGGGSGYSDGSVTVVSSTLGGNTGAARVVIRVVSS